MFRLCNQKLETKHLNQADKKWSLIEAEVNNLSLKKFLGPWAKSLE